MSGYHYCETCLIMVTKNEARREIEKHARNTDMTGPDMWSEFVQDHGENDEYEGKTVLDWLGY